MAGSKILLICSEYPPGPGGIGFHAYSLASALKREKKDITVLANADYADPVQVEKFDTAEPYRIRRFRRSGRLTPLLRCIDLYRALSLEKPKHVIITGRFPIWMLPIVALHSSKPLKHVIIHGHEPIMGSGLAKWFTCMVLKLADKLYPVSRFSASQLPEWLSRKKPVHVIPNGIHVQALGKYPKDEIRGRLDGFPVLLTVGHTSPRKGQHRVIKALPRLRERFPDIKYHIIGRDVNNKGLVELAKRFGVTDMIKFHPPVFPHDNLGLYYTSADIFMLLSENQPDGDVEGFGIVALEANYFKTPVIGAKDCGVEDAVFHGNSGCLVDGDDAEEITDAVSFLMEHPEIRDSSVEWAKQHDWSIIVKRFLPFLHHD